MEREHRRRSFIAFGIITALSVAYAAYVVAATHSLPGFATDAYEVTAVTPNAARLAPGSRVTSSGVAVGRVANIRRQGRAAVIQLEIDDESITPLPRDTTMRVRQRTPVGENYVEIMPGTEATDLDSGATLPLTQPDEYVELDEVLDSLSGETGERARALVRSLGGALDGRGERLNDLLHGASGTLDSLTVVADVGARQREKLKGLIADTGRIMNAIGERQGAIEELAADGLTTMGAVAERDRAVTALMRVLPSTLSQVRATTKTLGTTARRATPVVADLATAVAALRPTVAALRPASQNGRELVRELGRGITPLTRTLRRARTLAPSAVSALPGLRSALCEGNPVLRYVGRYRMDIASAVANMGSATNAYDALGHTARVSVVTGENAMAGLPAELSAGLATLLHTGVLSEMQGLTLDPYPQPGKIGATGLPPERQRALTTEQLGATDYPFERVMPDCQMETP